MINARDLLPMSWIANNKGFYARVVTTLPIEIPTFFPVGDIKWLINGEPEENWSGIPLTPELMRKIGWIVKDGKKTVVSIPVPMLGIRPDTYGGVWFFKEVTGDHKAGDICCGHRMRQLKFLHELQNHYRFDAGKHLEGNL